MSLRVLIRLLGGNGPKMIELEQMREVHLLQDRVELLGSVPPGEVGDVRLSDRTMRLVVAHLRDTGTKSRSDLPLYFPDGSLRF